MKVICDCSAVTVQQAYTFTVDAVRKHIFTLFLNTLELR